MGQCEQNHENLINMDYMQAYFLQGVVTGEWRRYRAGNTESSCEREEDINLSYKCTNCLDN